jgi:DNA-binding transcriptional ArsR family regulator
MSDWALGLRRAGVAVLFMHHSGKNGLQRGTSRREDILNVVLNLKHPADYAPENGASFEVHFEKGRELYGADSKPFLAKLVTVEGLQRWEIADLEASTFDQVVQMTSLGMQLHDIAAELEVNKSTVSRHLKRAREEGLIKKSP